LGFDLETPLELVVAFLGEAFFGDGIFGAGAIVTISWLVQYTKGFSL
jgi:hypothetical protein